MPTVTTPFKGDGLAISQGSPEAVVAIGRFGVSAGNPFTTIYAFCDAVDPPDCIVKLIGLTGMVAPTLMIGGVTTGGTTTGGTTIGGTTMGIDGNPGSVT